MIIRDRGPQQAGGAEAMGKKQPETTNFSVGYYSKALRVRPLPRVSLPAPRTEPARPTRVYTPEEVRANQEALARRIANEQAEDPTRHDEAPKDREAFLAWIETTRR